MQPEAQTTHTHVCFLAASAGDLKVAIVTKAPIRNTLIYIYIDVSTLALLT